MDSYEKSLNNPMEKFVMPKKRKAVKQLN